VSRRDKLGMRGTYVWGYGPQFAEGHSTRLLPKDERPLQARMYL
jgi:hypothetical protein